MIQGRRQAGFTLVATIFILVILATLGAFMVTLSAVSHASSSLSLQGARAYYAAYSGLEWATYFVTDSQSEHDELCGSPTTTAFNITTPPGTGLANGFTVTVSCDDRGHQTYTENGIQYQIATISSTATTIGIPIGAPDYATRTVTATVTTGGTLPPNPPSSP